jgi:hypothetical protein
MPLCVLYNTFDDARTISIVQIIGAILVQFGGRLQRFKAKIWSAKRPKTLIYSGVAR